MKENKKKTNLYIILHMTDMLQYNVMYSSVSLSLAQGSKICVDKCANINISHSRISSL